MLKEHELEIGEFNSYEDAMNFCKTIIVLAKNELDRAKTCQDMMDEIIRGTTNVWIKTDKNECHLHTSRNDDKAISATGAVYGAIKSIRERHLQAFDYYTNVVEEVASKEEKKIQANPSPIDDSDQ